MRTIIKELHLIAKEVKAFSRDKVLIDFTRYKLNNDLFWLKTALRLIYGNQTHDEQQLEKTIYKNLKGFSKPNADIITDIIREYLLTNGKLTSKTINILFRIMPKYAKQLYKRFPEIRDRAEEEISDPILRDKYIIPKRFENMFVNFGKTDRNYNFGDDIVIPQKEKLIYTGSTRGDLLKQVKLSKSIDTLFGKTAVSLVDLYNQLAIITKGLKDSKEITDLVQDAIEKIDKAMDLWEEEV